jgi:hypothetical protein
MARREAGIDAPRSHSRFPLALARGPQPCPAVVAFAPLACEFPLALARGPQPCPRCACVLPLCLWVPLCNCGFPLALARGPQPCPAVVAVSPTRLPVPPLCLPISPRACTRAPTVEPSALPPWVSPSTCRFPLAPGCGETAEGEGEENGAGYQSLARVQASRKSAPRYRMVRSSRTSPPRAWAASRRRELRVVYSISTVTGPVMR